MKAFPERAAVVRRFVLMISLCWLALAATGAWASPASGALAATLLPAEGDPQRSQLAVSWSGEAGATLSVALRPESGATSLLVEQALDTGVNLLNVPLPADASGRLELRAQTTEGVVVESFDVKTLRGDSFFAWESAFFGPGLDSGAGFGLGGGRIMIIWDDGNGPALYVAGGFVTAGTQRVDRIARWDGSTWSPLTGPLGTGINMDGGGNPSVKALAVHEGDLIVAGFFDNAGGVSVNNIARWDGSAWSALGAGLTGVIGVESLAVYNGELIAGGSFTQSGATAVNRVARWNGTQWLPLGSGVTGAEFNQTVQVWALAVYNNELIVGGNFLDAGGVAVNRIARWNGTVWAALGAGVAEAANPAATLPSVNAFAILHGELIVGGNFRQAGGQPAGAVARWNGSAWSALGSGMTGPGNVRVHTLAVSDNDLYAGGSFAEADGVTVNNVARWNGTQWSALSGPGGTGVGTAVEDLIVYQGSVIATGVDFPTAGGVVVNSLARWNGSAWSTFDGQVGRGVSGSIQAMTVWQGDLVVAGIFARAGGATVFAVARWDGSAWQPLSGPFAAGISAPPGAGVTPSANALAVFNGELILGGRFLDAGGIFVNHIARHDGTRWWPLGPDGAGIANSGGIAQVSSLAVYDGALIVGGQFDQAGGITANHIARWDGTTWSALGSGVVTSFAGVSALAVYNGELIAAGDFSQAGGVGANNIARWNGSVWAPLAGGISGWVQSLTPYAGSLIAGGNFSQAGAQTANNIARWDGSAWTPLVGAAGNGVNGQVLTVVEYSGELFAGGRFTQAGGLTVNYAARWNGGDWLPMAGIGGAGVASGGLPEIRAMAVVDLDDAGPQPAKLAAGGQFNLTGGVSNWNLGVYGPSGPLRVLSVTPGNAQFGTVLVGWPAPPQTVTLSSVGSAPVTVDAIPAPAAPFERSGGTCPATPFTLAPLATCTLEYRFVPTADGPFVHTILIEAATDGAQAAFNLLGTGLIEQRPPILDVTPDDVSATVPEGQTASRPLAIANLGDQALDWALSQSPFASPAGFGDVVLAMTVWDDGTGPALYVAGEDDSGFHGVARWDGERWSYLGAGMNADINALLVYDGDLIAGGNFTKAGGLTVNRVARWDGTQWTALDHGLAGSSTARVNALAVHAGGLIAAGNFTDASGVPANAIARWDGTQWSALGAGLGNQVAALAVYDGALIAGGTFNTGGLSRIARWDGSAWLPLGSGVASTVLSLAVHDGGLIVGGGFTSAGGQPASRIARWDGTTWSALGAGVNNQVSAMASFGGALYAGGIFSDSGGAPLNRVARWDGTTWSALGTGVGARASAMAVFDGALYIGGQFTDAGGLAVDRLARWDGTTWSALTPAAPIVCTLPAWAELTPASGTTAGGATTPATVGFDATGLGLGEHTATLCLTSNDPGQPTVAVPLTLTVNDGSGAPVIDATPDSLAATLAPGASETQSLAIANLGGQPLNWQVSDTPGAFERVGAIDLAPDEDGIFTAIIDHAGQYAYYAANTLPGKIVKVDLATFQRVDGITLPLGDDQLRSVVIDPEGHYAYFGTGGAPGRVVKVDLTTFQRVGSITLGDFESGLRSAVIDPAGEFAYFGTGVPPGQVVKVNLTTFQRVGALELAGGEFFLDGAVIDPAGQFAYFMTNTDPGRLVKIDLATFQRVGAVVFNANEIGSGSLAMDPAGEFVYVGTSLEPKHVVKIDLATFQRVGALNITQGIDQLSAATIDPAGRFAYFGTGGDPAWLAKIDLASFQQVDAITMVPGENVLASAAMAPDGRHAYFSTYTTPGRVVKVAIGEDCALPDWVEVAPASGTVAGGGSQSVDVTFDAAGLTVGSYEANLCLASNDPATPVLVVPLSLEVAGNPSLAIEPGAIDFGSVPAGVSAGPAMATLTNTSAAALTVESIDAASVPFQRSGGDCPTASFELAPGASCTLGHVFAPTATGVFEQTLTVSSDVGPATLTLRGTGIAVFPAQLILLSGDDQSATVGTPFAVPLAVQVRDDFNNPVPNIGVTFVAPEEGASAVLSQTTVMTDGNGYAAVNATANGIAGSYVVTAFGGLGAPVEFSLSNVSASPDLAVSIVASREHVRPGQLLDYVISVHNLGPDATSQADVLSTLSPLLDLSATSWQCLGPTASGCTAAGQGNLADDGLSLPAQGSVLYTLRSAVPLQGEEGPVETAATVVAPGDANPGNDSAAALTPMVLYRHGFELYGDGASALEPAVDSLAADDEATLVWPATGAALVDTALLALADDGTGVRVDRLAAGSQGWARLVAIAADGRERAGAWTPVPAGAELTLAFADTAADGEQPATRTALLLGAGVELRIALDGLPPSYRVRSATPLEIGDGEAR